MNAKFEYMIVSNDENEAEVEGAPRFEDEAEAWGWINNNGSTRSMTVREVVITENF